MCDVALVFFVYFLFAQWHVVVGLLAAFLYVSNAPFDDLVSIPYYYYWDIPIAFLVLGFNFLGDGLRDVLDPATRTRT